MEVIGFPFELGLRQTHVILELWEKNLSKNDRPTQPDLEELMSLTPDQVYEVLDPAASDYLREAWREHRSQAEAHHDGNSQSRCNSQVSVAAELEP